MQRIGISGTRWTGKSTTIRTIVKQNPQLTIETFRLGSLVEECPHATGEHQTLEASRWVTERLAEVLASPSTADIQVFDRTPLDVFAYTLLAQGGKKGRGREIFDDLLDLVRRFDRIFFVRASEQWPLGGPHSETEIEFALKMDGLMDEAVRRFELDVFILPWDPAERYDIITTHIKH
ncbi:MAG: AAA family ATPase [Planctomycetes bacterium]|nr:AAA family ATPase [Planctomycetota bacterium]